MVFNRRWIGIGALGALLTGAVIVGCATQKSNPDNIPAAPVATVQPAITSADASSKAAAGSFDDAANTWGQVEMARTELDTAIKARQLDQVHIAAAKISDLVKTLPGESAMLPDDKRKTLDAHVKNVGELSAMINKSDNPNDMKSTQEHQTAMNDALDMMKGMYPAEAMRPSMPMPNMDSSGKGMPDDKMSGKGPAGKGMSGMGDKMGGMGKKPDPGKMPGPNNKPMPTGGMGGDM